MKRQVIIKRLVWAKQPLMTRGTREARARWLAALCGVYRPGAQRRARAGRGAEAGAGPDDRHRAADAPDDEARAGRKGAEADAGPDDHDRVPPAPYYYDAASLLVAGAASTWHADWAIPLQLRQARYLGGLLDDSRG